MENKAIVVGYGQIGKAMAHFLSGAGFRVSWINKKEKQINDKEFDVMHVCFPQINGGKFVQDVLMYIVRFSPKLVIINSTILPGTTRKIKEKSIEKDLMIVHSPCQGQHDELVKWIRRHTKWIGAMDEESGRYAEKHFKMLGLKTRLVNKPEITELAKLLDVTQYTILIAWAQEAERICKEFEVKHKTIREFGEEVHEFLNNRPDIYPGIIGGHCLIPDLELLMDIHKCKFFDAIWESNTQRIEEEKQETARVKKANEKRFLTRKKQKIKERS